MDRKEPDTAEGTGAAGSGDYAAKESDCMHSIAYVYGFCWTTLWNHPNNAELKRVRKDPFVLLEGDRVFIPPLRGRVKQCSTERRHPFVRKGVPAKLRIVVKWLGKPRANERYRLDIDGRIFQGTTNSLGLIEVAIPPNASQGLLTVGQREQEQQVFPLDLGGMDPITEISGVQKRLENLGFPCAPSGTLDDRTRQAITLFQQGHDLPVTGELDHETRDRIQREYQV